MVSAKTSDDPKNNISVFLVPKNAPGFKIGSLFHKLGMRASDTGELFFDNLRLPSDALIGQEGKGLRAALSLLDEARLGVASCALGIAEESIDRARTFVKDRVAFGKPLATKQGLQWYLAEMQMSFDAAQALVLQAAQAYDAGESIVTSAAEAKLFATKVAIEVSGKAVQMCGGYGLIEDFGVERLYRDAKMCAIIEGTDEVLKMVVSRAVLA